MNILLGRGESLAVQLPLMVVFQNDRCMSIPKSDFVQIRQLLSSYKRSKATEIWQAASLQKKYSMKILEVIDKKRPALVLYGIRAGLS
ncbi:hypothetical protein EDM59_11770 [Brevibacillus nitrificans]|uniref:Uncharacterized protein n=1 Tax=Brevibacillus nitrificans TaxID=651560 RepID=A0A3M8DFP5_9BACL|nr:hypothetical protein EDM59_11770 [Brevibacillus nitrificans]